MASYDLLSEPWVPVLDAGRDLRDTPDAPVALRTVGLREAVGRAHEIREVVGDTPLETVSLNRLLLALVLDIHDVGAETAPWLALWAAGRVDADALDAYLGRQAERFDLLHPRRPFYQVPADAHPARDETTLSQLRHAEAAGNNGTLFGHEMDDPPRPDGEPARRLSLAEAARSILAYQAYGLGGLAGSAAAGGRLPAFKHAPLVSGAVFWLRGRSLFESLLLNAPPHPDVWASVGEDVPAWRRDLPITTVRPREGLRDLLTWQARLVSLATAPTPDGATVATGVSIANGETIDTDGVPDPMMARMTSKTGGVFPYGLRAERAVWRDLALLLHATGPEAEGAPETFRAVADLVYQGHLPFAEGDPLEADIFGLVKERSNKHKVGTWQHARVPVYPRLVGDRARLDVLRNALEDAEEQARSLHAATRTTAEYLLAPPPPGSDDRPDADTKSVSALVASLGAERRYWMAAEPAFAAFLRTLASAPDIDARSDALDTWDTAIERAAAQAFEAATSALDRSARHLRAQAQGLRVLRPVERLRTQREADARASARTAA